MPKKFTLDEKPTTELFLSTILDRQACSKHEAALGVPCFYIEGGSNDFGSRAICNSRARRAGFNHRISEKSLRLNGNPKPRPRKR